MNETIVCTVGNVATRPVYRDLAAGPSARFRLAVTARYWDREKSTWTDGHTNFFTVWANRQLAANAAASLSVGDPVIVQGRLKVRSETREGQQGWASADIDAVAIGHDLARGTSAFRRGGRPENGSAPAAGTAPGTAGAAGTAPEPDWETPPANPGNTGKPGTPGKLAQPNRSDPEPHRAPVPAPVPVAAT
ncbi:single-stranded DNA-binding protein [Streptomyces sp. NPDC047000]|uniref:single-stranded DNA-binding protein n=1 Tax=Streptomyces sp. NPDC047000 TaxID=3155474 RepID=UPI0033FCB483